MEVTTDLIDVKGFRDRRQGAPFCFNHQCRTGRKDSAHLPTTGRGTVFRLRAQLHPIHRDPGTGWSDLHSRGPNERVSAPDATTTGRYFHVCIGLHKIDTQTVSTRPASCLPPAYIGMILFVPKKTEANTIQHLVFVSKANVRASIYLKVTQTECCITVKSSRLCGKRFSICFASAISS